MRVLNGSLARAVPTVDVSYVQLLREPALVLDSIYAGLGLPLADATRQRFAEKIAEYVLVLHL